MSKLKGKNEFQKRVFRNIEKTIKEYLSKKDVRGATAFSYKMKDKMEAMFEIIQNSSGKSKAEREELIKVHRKQIEDCIITAKSEVAEIMARENQIPYYIGFILNEKGGIK